MQVQVVGAKSIEPFAKVGSNPIRLRLWLSSIFILEDKSSTETEELVPGVAYPYWASACSFSGQAQMSVSSARRDVYHSMRDLYGVLRKYPPLFFRASRRQRGPNSTSRLQELCKGQPAHP